MPPLDVSRSDITTQLGNQQIHIPDAPATTEKRPAATDHQAETIQSSGGSDRAKATRRVGLLGRIVRGVAIAGMVIATAVGGMFVANKMAEHRPAGPVVPIEVPVDVAPGQLPDATAPPGNGGATQNNGPVRTPTLPGFGTEQTDTTPRVFTPIQIRSPDGTLNR